jgi:peptidoglycan/xylan/chitin deacetylase (PgdA/CDA1 family)
VFETSEPAVAFTFDDGPDPETTPRVLDLLARHGAHATFFVVGCRAAEHPELVRRIVAEGHALGSHTYEHSHVFHFRSARRMREDIQRGIAAIAHATGSEPTLFRPPQGLRTPLLRDALARLPLVCVTWTGRGLDTLGRPASRIVARLEPEVRPGAILTLHDGHGFGGRNDRRPTVDALGRLLELAGERGLRCVSLAALERS